MLPALIPAILWIGKEVFGILEPGIARTIAGKLGDLSTQDGTLGSIAQDVIGVFKEQGVAISQEQEQEFKLQMQSILSQTELNEVAEKEDPWFRDVRDILFGGLSLALLLSVLVEPTINYILGFFCHTPPPPFVLSPIVLAMLSGLCGLHMVTSSVDNGVNNGVNRRLKK